MVHPPLISCKTDILKVCITLLHSVGITEQKFRQRMYVSGRQQQGITALSHPDGTLAGFRTPKHNVHVGSADAKAVYSNQGFSVLRI